MDQLTIVTNRQWLTQVADQTVIDDDGNGGETTALDGTGSSDPDGTIASYVWTEDGNQIATGANPSLSLSVGTHNILLTVTDNDGATDSDDVVITVEEGVVASTEVWLEAECGTVGSLWNTGLDGSASNGAYITIQSGNNSTDNAPINSAGHVSFNVNLSESGDYTLWARVIAPSPSDDSYWVQIDGGAWVMWNGIAPGSTTWTWDEVSVSNLNAGSHTITIAYREDGTSLDKLYLSNTGTTPTGSGTIASNNCTIDNEPVDPNPTWRVSARIFEDGPSGAFDDVAVKDPTIVFSDGLYHLFYTGRDANNWRMGYVSSPDINNFHGSTRHFLSSLNGGGYFAAPQVFYSEAKGQWYLIYQSGQGATFSTNSDVGNPNGWTAGQPMGFNDGIDFWCISDGVNVYCFYSAQDGSRSIKRRSTSVANFPTGWSAPSTIADNTFEAVHVYKNLADGEFYLITEDIARHQELWTASSLGGTWTKIEEQWAHRDDLIDEADHWTDQVSHVEVVRAGVNEFLEVNNLNDCEMLIQGVVDGDYGSYGNIPYDLGILRNGDGPTNNNNIEVRALGTDGTETLELEIDGSVVATWTMSTSYQVYSYSGPSSGVFRLNFTNDAAGLDVQVDYLEVDGTTYQAEDQAVNTALYANGACGGGSNSELMHCNGYIQFGVGGVCPDTDGDGTNDCSDQCPTDPNKTTPGDCGCGVAEGNCGGLQFAIPGGNQGLAACKAKFVGNIVPGSIRSDFGNYWNQVTPENGGKWGSVEPSRDFYNWGNLDLIYNYAQQNNIPFKQHVFIWGSQQPNWLAGLSAADQRAEVEEWYSLFAQRYPNTAIIDVVNESLPGHAPDVAVKNALGGANNGASIPYLQQHPEYGPYGTGWDYIIYAFAKARDYFPNAILVLNDYNIINNTSAINQHLQIVNILKDRGLIDGVGIQAHAFSVDNMSAAQVTSNLNLLDNAGLPIHVTELDIRGSNGNEAQQRDRYAQIFPAFYEHPAVAGVTLWGYVEGQTWMEFSGILNSNGTERLAMQWLRSYLQSQPNVCPGNKVAFDADHTDDAGIAYPNPFTDELHIVSDQELTYEVYDLMGHKLLDGQCDGSCTITNDLTPGVYLLELSSETDKSTIRIVKD